MILVYSDPENLKQHIINFLFLWYVSIVIFAKILKFFGMAHY